MIGVWMHSLPNGILSSVLAVISQPLVSLQLNSNKQQKNKQVEGIDCCSQRLKFNAIVKTKK